MWDGKAMVRAILVAFVFIATSVFAGEECFLRGNKYYAEKDYDSALKEYHLINKKGPAVLYNMGNCFFHKEDYPQAFVHWSRAEVGANSNEYNRIQHNKQLALRKLGKEKTPSWWRSIVVFLQSKLFYISLLLLQLLFLLCWWLFILLMRKKKTGAKKVVQSMVSFCVVFLAMLLGMQYMQENTCAAMVVKKEAKLFAGPNTSFHVLSPVAYADRAHIKEAREGWYKIQYADMIGWVEEDVIQVI
jgi:hypothetical protein